MVVQEQKQLARLLGTTDRSIRNWISDARESHDKTLPDFANGYDVDQWRAWANANGKLNGGGRQAGSDNPDQQSLTKLKVARAAVELELAKLELDQRRRSLLPQDQVRDVLMECAGRIRALTTQLRKATSITPEDAARLIEDVTDQFERSVKDRLR